MIFNSLYIFSFNSVLHSFKSESISLNIVLRLLGSNLLISEESWFIGYWLLSILLSIKKEKTNYSLKGILCGGQILNDEVRRNFEKRFKVNVFEGYGLTETTSFSCINCYPKNKRVIGSIGKELPINDFKSGEKWTELMTKLKDEITKII